MRILNIIRGFIPLRIKKILKDIVNSKNISYVLSKELSQYLPDLICVDIGASYYPHPKWKIFLNAHKVNWIAVEPNEKNLFYVQKWEWLCKITTIKKGLSKTGGDQSLYITNVDSGSSLLPPVISASMKHRISNLDYFFPVIESKVKTVTLCEILDIYPNNVPIIIKLDTQGTELSILEGAKPLFENNRIIGVESEATLQAEPCMQGSGKFWQLNAFLEEKGMELLEITPIYHYNSSSNNGYPKGQRLYLNECDAVFSIRRDIASKLEIEYRAALLAFYISYNLFFEATSLLSEDSELVEYFRNRGCNVSKIVKYSKRYK